MRNVPRGTSQSAHGGELTNGPRPRIPSSTIPSAEESRKSRQHHPGRDSASSGHDDRLGRRSSKRRRKRAWPDRDGRVGSSLDDLAHLDSHVGCRTRGNDCFHVNDLSRTQWNLECKFVFLHLQCRRWPEIVSERYGRVAHIRDLEFAGAPFSVCESEVLTRAGVLRQALSSSSSGLKSLLGDFGKTRRSHCVVKVALQVARPDQRLRRANLPMQRMPIGRPSPR
jgi:hypothetical protein